MLSLPESSDLFHELHPGKAHIWQTSFKKV
jgi:hypothetical protein